MHVGGRRLVAYALRVTATRFAGAFSLLTALYAVVDAIEGAEVAGATLLESTAAFPLKLPTVICHVTPVAAAMAVVLAYGALLRRGEWVAAAAAGVRPTTLFTGMFAVPAAIGLLSWPLAHELAPRALSLYEARLSGDWADAEPAARWSRHGQGLLVREAADGARVEVRRERDGRVSSYAASCGKGGALCVWRSGVGWSRSTDRDDASRYSGGETVPMRRGAFGLVGASFATSEIEAYAHALEEGGHSASHLRAQVALRNATSAANLVVPALAMVLVTALGVFKAHSLVAAALLAAAGFTVVLSTVWNAAVFGAVSPRWADAGVVAALAAAGALLFFWGRRRTTALRW